MLYWSKRVNFAKNSDNPLLEMFFRYLNRFLIIATLCGSALTVMAAELDTLPVKTIDGKSFHYYTVQSHETLYALSKRFGVSEKQILKLNPSASEGIKAGQDLLIGKAKKNAAATEYYTVKKQETAYGISKRFGITLERFYELNPQAKEGVQQGQVVIVKAASGATPAPKKEVVAEKKQSKSAEKPAAVSGKKHTIAEHETLYQIARNYNVSLSDLLAANPTLDTAHYTVGTVIVIPESTKSTSKSASPLSSQATYTVKSGDTFYGIATRHGVDMAQLYAANPGVDVLKEGMVITLPDACPPASELPESIAARPTSVSDTVTVAVVLPFMVHNRDKHNKTMVEFYRGFLLAVDSLRSFGQPIRILTYDTNGTDDGLKSVLAAPALKTAKAIVAPDKSEHLAALNQFGLENRIAVLNVFNNRDSAYQVNPFAIQGAMPRDEMYDRASKAFIESFEGYTPVFLVSNDGRRDKVEFIDIVKSQLAKAGKDYKEIAYNGTLSLETLNGSLDSGKKYAFLPGSSHKDEFDRLATALLAYKDGRDFKNEVVVWGYPEWLANNGGRTKMHDLDSYIYSRNNLPETFVSQPVNNGYAHWYGPGMMTSFPRRAYMGFDAGMFLLKAISANGGDFTKSAPYVSGLTMPFSLKRHEKGGFYNNELLLINLSPGEIVSKRTI